VPFPSFRGRALREQESLADALPDFCHSTAWREEVRKAWLGPHLLTEPPRKTVVVRRAQMMAKPGLLGENPRSG
jgi:hypothetical protein